MGKHDAAMRMIFVADLPGAPGKIETDAGAVIPGGQAPLPIPPAPIMF